jgi:mono/diheme cytochrome c family protein
MDHKIVGRIAVLFAVLVFTPAHLPLARSAQAKKPSRAPAANPDSGEQLYKRYCAVCHGHDLKGNDRISTEFKNPPPDLTTLAQRHKGEFPDAFVESVLRNGVSDPAHRNSEMPIWGSVFAASKDENPQIATTRILNLTSYIKSLQAKPKESTLSF